MVVVQPVVQRRTGAGEGGEQEQEHQQPGESRFAERAQGGTVARRGIYASGYFGAVVTRSLDGNRGNLLSFVWSCTVDIQSLDDSNRYI